ncbi:MAG: alpha/beta hydrolase [Bacteroidetes bacterium]|nr:alpha/beta hydrolase [Bacteroidota bacterium]MCW5896017.1 alpha/beta hydrolase [Bacteroidota bacterium]
MREKLHVKRLQVNSTELHYVEAGSGTLAVCVHGTLGDYRTWQKQINILSNACRVVAYSRRYHFPNRKSDTLEYSASLHAEDLAKLVRRFTDSPAHIITASWGGNVALQLALSHPSLVRTIVLGEPPVLPLLEHDPRLKKLLDGFNHYAFFPAREALQKGRNEDGIRYFIDGVIGKGAYDAMPASVHRRFLDNVEELSAETMSTDYIPDFTRDEIGKVRCPVLLVEGGKSPPFFHAILDVLESHLPNAERVRIPDASHGIHSDNADEYNTLVLDFLLRH